jgi:hypothetical protein
VVNDDFDLFMWGWVVVTAALAFAIYFFGG